MRKSPSSATHAVLVGAFLGIAYGVLTALPEIGCVEQLLDDGTELMCGLIFGALNLPSLYAINPLFNVFPGASDALFISATIAMNGILTGFVTGLWVFSRKKHSWAIVFQAVGACIMVSIATYVFFAR